MTLRTPTPAYISYKSEINSQFTVSNIIRKLSILKTSLILLDDPFPIMPL